MRARHSTFPCGQRSATPVPVPRRGVASLVFAVVLAASIPAAADKVNVEPFEAESAYEVTLRNQKSAPITVAVRDRIDGDWQMLESSLSSRKEDAQTLAFDVPVPAGGEAVLRYRVRVGR
jgi:hypothetical protein